ncbi:tyrosine-protein phosphatase non-receptor type 2-like [Antechinus flavipes]|uniref:tyrosine-protein phosphatase non-receptor type 2-like n=1 Tax=Antechinus flavipes TaxID=38775 RepID=UPI002235F273|nr:tyrosine-protein phosphatase non-receptor type 2-like [Antechinus flavipes]
MPMSMETEFEELDANEGWAEAHLEVSDQCRDYYASVGRTWENRSRNRYPDLTPYDHSRVRGGDEYNDYINASFVVMEAAQRKYILTQGPLPNTFGHFWLMVWQQNTRAVVMLNRVTEKNPVQSYQYWPSSSGQTLLFEEAGITVHMLREEVKSHHTIHYLRLQNMMTGEAKSISHFHFTSWPDLGVPESPTPFLAFLFMIRESGFLNYEQEPVVIHCRAGVDASGTFALIDSCLVLMEKKDDPFTLNIKRVLVIMRKYRMGLVQTPDQLRFSYMAIIEGAKYLMGDESVKKKWKDFNCAEQGPSYFYGDIPPQRYRRFRLVLEKDEGESQLDLFSLASEMPNSGEDNSENSLKRLREAGKSNIEEEELQNKEKPCEIKTKRKRKKVNK